MSSPAPYGGEGLDYFAGMGEHNAADHKLMVSDRPAWMAKAAEEAAMAAGATAEQMFAYYSSLVSDADRAALTPEVAEFLLRQVKEGLRPGISGAVDDNLAQREPWGFDLAVIRVPLQYWHGGEDRFVPYTHGKWLATRLPKAEVHLQPSEGRLSLFTKRVPQVHEWLSSHF